MYYVIVVSGFENEDRTYLKIGSPEYQPRCRKQIERVIEYCLAHGYGVAVFDNDIVKWSDDRNQTHYERAISLLRKSELYNES